MKIAKLAILAGGGILPTLLQETCNKKNIPTLLATFKGQPEPDGEVSVSAIYHLGALGKTVKALKKEGVSHLVMAGYMTKPSLFDLRLDIKAVQFLASLVKHHDDALLSGLVKVFEKEGIQVVGAHEILPELLAPEGPLGNAVPSDKDMVDIDLGVETIATLGDLDIGQAAIIKDNVVIGVEAVEGTAKLVDRCAELRGKKNKGGILVKRSKPQQSLKVDMPAIGENTINQLAQHGYRGVAIEAGKTLVLHPEAVREAADKHNIFVFGLEIK